MHRMQKISLPLKMVELESGNYHPMVQSVFPDGSTGNWVVDTGASKTVFDLTKDCYYNLLEDNSDEETVSAGIGIGSLETKTGEIESVSFGKLVVQNLKVALLDLSHINKLYDTYSSEKIYGLLGSDLLLKYNALIDYKRKELTLSREG